MPVCGHAAPVRPKARAVEEEEVVEEAGPAAEADYLRRSPDQGCPKRRGPTAAGGTRGMGRHHRGRLSGACECRVRHDVCTGPPRPPHAHPPLPTPRPLQDNHKSSAFKFLILAELLSVG